MKSLKDKELEKLITNIHRYKEHGNLWDRRNKRVDGKNIYNWSSEIYSLICLLNDQIEGYLDDEYVSISSRNMYINNKNILYMIEKVYAKGFNKLKYLGKRVVYLIYKKTFNN